MYICNLKLVRPKKSSHGKSPFLIDGATIKAESIFLQQHIDLPFFHLFVIGLRVSRIMNWHLEAIRVVFLAGFDAADPSFHFLTTNKSFARARNHCLGMQVTAMGMAKNLSKCRTEKPLESHVLEVWSRKLKALVQRRG